jgi:hypothetical protein
MLTMRVGPSQPPWWVWLLVVGIFVAALINTLVGRFRDMTTSLATRKSLAGAGASLAGRPASMPRGLTVSMDLVGQALTPGLLVNPLLSLVSTIIATVVKVRQTQGTDIPRQYLTDQLVTKWASGSLYPIERGVFSITELHARPLVPAGDHMLVWFKASVEHGQMTEYWTFVSRGPTPTLPINCPSCGAPTVGTASETCQYCGAILWQPPSDAPIYWLVDDISRAAPAAIAA